MLNQGRNSREISLEILIVTDATSSIAISHFFGNYELIFYYPNKIMDNKSETSFIRTKQDLILI